MPTQRNAFLVLADAVFIASIDWYQKYLSPHKGWRCAYGALHGGPGCSGFAKSAIQTHGWCRARLLVRQRFRQCKIAARQLRAQSGVSPLLLAAQPSERKKKDCLADLACDCVPESCGEASCDLPSCDFCACSW